MNPIASNRCLVVVSYYDRRSPRPLYRLMESLGKHAAGDDFDVCIVINKTQKPRLDFKRLGSARVIYRDNTGMNIGAWDYGWRQNPGYRDYLFLQDECFLVAPGWLAAFRARSLETGGGLLGESMNSSWDGSWQALWKKQSSISMPGHLLDGRPANRVDVYLDFMRRCGIDPGDTGLHLRSLVWYADAGSLSKIGGFPVGSNYGECIAAEIGVSRKAISLGLSIGQVSQAPFTFFRHREWTQSAPGAPFIHASSVSSVRRLKRQAVHFIVAVKDLLFNAAGSRRLL